MAVSSGSTHVRLIGEAADPQLGGAEVLACEAALEAWEPVAHGVLDVEQVHDRVVGHAPMLDPASLAEGAGGLAAGLALSCARLPEAKPSGTARAARRVRAVGAA